MDYLKSFVIGSSFSVFIIFYLMVFNLSNNIKQYSNEKYAIIAPFYFGIMNVISLYIGKKFDLTLRERLLIISVTSIILVISYVKIFNVYNLTNSEWNTYYLTIIITHLFAFNIIIYLLEKNLS